MNDLREVVFGGEMVADVHVKLQARSRNVPTRRCMRQPASPASVRARGACVVLMTFAADGPDMITGLATSTVLELFGRSGFVDGLGDAGAEAAWAGVP